MNAASSIVVPSDRSMRILIVGDDEELAGVNVRGFLAEGIDVVLETTIAGGRTRAIVSEFDAIVLDAMLGGGDVFEVCREIRKRGIGTPVLTLTTRAQGAESVGDLCSYCDDYLSKPFVSSELIARVRTLALRRPAMLPPTIECADLVVDVRMRRVKRGGRSINLTAKEFALLECLGRTCGDIVDRATIVAHVWGGRIDQKDNVLEVLVRRLRRKIDDDFPVKLIRTIRGAGYRLGA